MSDDPPFATVMRRANLDHFTRLIQYCSNTKDFMVPSLWVSVSVRRIFDGI